jgi:signal transduction histidine kinase
MSAKVLILNVDDDAAARYVKSRILRSRATSGGGGQWRRRDAAPARPAPDLVLLDVRLPTPMAASSPRRSRRIRDRAGGRAADIGLARRTRHRVASLDAAPMATSASRRAEELVATCARSAHARGGARRQKALDALVEADRRKDEFLAMLAHELRNPLAPIRNAVEILRLSDDRAVRERARVLVGRQVQHLSRSWTTCSRSRASRSARSCCGERACACRDRGIGARGRAPAFEALDHKVTCRCPRRPLARRGRRAPLQVMGNLLNNAAKFTPRAARSGSRRRLEDAGLTIVVTDDGMGIAPDVLPTSSISSRRRTGRSSARKAGSASGSRW